MSRYSDEYSYPRNDAECDFSHNDKAHIANNDVMPSTRLRPSAPNMAETEQVADSRQHGDLARRPLAEKTASSSPAANQARQALRSRPHDAISPINARIAAAGPACGRERSQLTRSHLIRR